ncbi:MAG: hypothetical protein HS111_01635 [Kofleriaceae bacterium]|nr:hypothetical protein [Kofleriaceae bacterium]
MKRRPGTDDATRVRMTTGDDELAAALLGRLDDHAGPARRLPQARAQAMVSAIVDAALTGVDGADASSPGATTAARPSRRLAPLLAVALLLARGRRRQAPVWSRRATWRPAAAAIARITAPGPVALPRLRPIASRLRPTPRRRPRRARTTPRGDGDRATRRATGAPAAGALGARPRARPRRRAPELPADAPNEP